MNKIKVLIPSLGILILSTVATVSGSLAWFTANRAVTISTDNFQITALDGNLTATLTNLAGTTIGGANNDYVSAKGEIGDASFNHLTGDLFTDVPDEDGNQPTSYEKKSTLEAASDATWQVGTTGSYYAIAWNVALHNEFSADTTNLDVFFSGGESSAIFNDGASFSGADASKTHTYFGFRIAFVTDTESVVWAPFRSSTDGVTKSYVNNESALANYVDSDLILSDTYGASGLEKAVDEGAENSTRKDHLGVITPSADTLNIKCVVWFEGSDPTTINESTMDRVKSSLKFYVRKVAA